MANNSHNAIRKAALLVSGLDTAAADALLGGMPPEVAARVRNAVLELDEIDPAEQRQILLEFRRASAGENNSANDGVELETSLARRLEESRENPSTYHMPSERQQPPFHFLHDADAAVLARQLAREQAQTIAVVLAHLRPAHAAEVLGQLLPEQQTAVLQRLADLDQADPEVLGEIESQLQNVLAAHLRASERKATGRSTIAAILSAASPHVRTQLATRLGHAAPQPVVASAETDEEVIAPNSSLASAIERLNRAPARTAATKPKTPSTPAPGFAFAELTSLDDRSLALVLQTAGPKVTLVALAGANSELLARLLGRLPARDGQMLRSRVQAVGPVNVRDMQAAQSEIARVAGTLAAAKRITLPARRLSLAA